MEDGPARVLVVDDITEMRALIRVMLELTHRYEVVGEAANGRDAITVAARTQPDIVVLDELMPVLSGLDALPRILESSPGSHVVMFTSLGAHLGPACVELGAAAFVEKRHAHTLVDVLDRVIADVLPRI